MKTDTNTQKNCTIKKLESVDVKLHKQSKLFF